MGNSDTVLVVGGGGREYAISQKLAESPHVKAIYVTPGNAGTGKLDKCENVSLSVKDLTEVSRWCKARLIDMVIVGPEDPLAAGITDHLTAEGIPCFGPTAKASQIESSKEFAKKFMTRHGIPTAKFESFTDATKAVHYIENADHRAWVVKASGLAAGKGVVVATSQNEACRAVREILQERRFGEAGETVIVEELLEGDEVSCLAFCDGRSVAMMPPAQDHKRLLDGDTGPNTGGMGALCPYPKLGERELEQIRMAILQKAVDGLKAEGTPYVGVLFAGLMLTRDGPKVLEFNCRLGDPETQAIFPLLKSDLYTTIKSCILGVLDSNLPKFHSDRTVISVAVVSAGYPGSYRKGRPISGLEEVEKLGLTVCHAGTAVEDGRLVTSGGRVLYVMATNDSLEAAASVARKGAALVKFDGATFRTDIACRVIHRCLHTPPLTYADAGVDIAAGNSLVDTIRPLSASSSRAGCMATIGSFGALFDLKAAGFRDPILVSGTDGVGTKLKIAQTMDQHKTIGIDLVAMCVNDILAHGAEPLFFLDYFATGKLNVKVARDVVAGVTEGCQAAGCALVGGETAEMPGLYHHGDYDVAGFAVGAVERDGLLPRIHNIKIGDAIIGLPSSGIHSNGFSLVRKLVEKLELRYDEPSPLMSGRSLGDDLLTPTRIYVGSVLPLLRSGVVPAFAHITGGGLLHNIPRVLPAGMRARLNAKCWTVPPVFGWLTEKGNIPEHEMAKTFNCGIGGVVVVDNSSASQVVEQLRNNGEMASVIGHVEKQSDETGDVVIIDHLQAALVQSWSHHPAVDPRKRVAVLISGSGTNLQALIDFTRDSNNQSAAEIVLVISNKPDVQGLTRASDAGIATKVIRHTDYKSREDFDEALHKTLKAADIEIICLAGFMRILTGGFVQKWRGRMLNVHPSLLPAFKGADAHKQVLASGVRISGCTVHFVAEEVDAGAILAQESVPVHPGDTEASLAARVKSTEHRAFPTALQLVASGWATLASDGRIQWKS